MLDILNGYGHGFVAIPTILACRETGVFEALRRHGPLTVADLAGQLRANSGHLSAAMRLLVSLEWLRHREGGAFELCIEPDRYEEIRGDMLDWWAFPLESYLNEPAPSASLRSWLDACQASWHVTDANTVRLMNGVFAIPLLTAMDGAGLLKPTGPGREPAFCRMAHDTTRRELTELCIALDWASDHGNEISLTDLGVFLSERALISGTLCAYMPMLSRLPQMLTGDASTVFQRDEQGHERHVERTLNVVASGFQHEKYFSDVDDTIVSIFDELPLDQQPAYVADMGCGDGTFLKRVYSIIAEKTSRGSVLSERPLQMIGADFNQKALDATTENLTGIPHRVIRGDIGDPGQLVKDLESAGVPDPGDVLHIRSFLDHDRPMLTPRDTAGLNKRTKLPYQGVYVDSEGAAIQPAVVVQSLVEHLSRWAAVSQKHGLVLLEVHSVPAAVAGQFFDQCESLHFDAYHAYSMQYLVDADVFLMCAAEAGLFAVPQFFRRYPKSLPFCRITLSWFKKRPYTIRNAYPEEIDEVFELCNADGASSISREHILQAVTDDPFGSFVVEMDGRMIGTAICLRTSDHAGNDVVYEPTGDAVRLLALGFDPSYADDRLRSELTDFVLQHSQLKAGVTKTVGFGQADQGDPIAAVDSSPQAVNDSEADVPQLVEQTIQQLMEDNGQSFSSQKTLYELGLDSLDHMELATLLGKSLGHKVDSSVLIKHNTPESLGSFLQKRASKRNTRGSWLSFLKRGSN